MRGFSLVELSIVLVILGLLTGGILAGRSLIRASELRAVGTEHSRWITATRAFQDKYLGLPGDLTNATAFWGKDATNCNSHTGTAAANGVCNGNGNTTLNAPTASGGWGEEYQFWRQLSFAGLIEGSYSGLSGSAGLTDTEVGMNAPASKLGKAGWSTGALLNYPGDSGTFAYNYRNFLMFGNPSTTNRTFVSALRPEEAWNLDSKVDDGMPGRGKLMMLNWPSCTNAANYSDLDTTYKLDNNAIACSLIFPNAS